MEVYTPHEAKPSVPEIESCSDVVCREQREVALSVDVSWIRWTSHYSNIAWCTVYDLGMSTLYLRRDML